MKKVVLCSSVSLEGGYMPFVKELQKTGIEVHYPSNMKAAFKDLTEEQQYYMGAGLTYDFIHHIRTADAVFLYNKDGYAGVSVTLELGVASALAKRVYSLEEDQEIARKVLIHDICPTPEELILRVK